MKSFLPRYSLRSLMLAITGVAVFLGTWVARAEQQRFAVASLRTIEFCDIGYEFDAPPGCTRLWIPLGSTYRPRWIDEVIGVDGWHSVIDITIPTTRLDGAMELLRQLPALREVYIYPYDADNEDEEKRQLQQGFEKVHRALPHVTVDEATQCPISVSTIPVLGS